jgi:NADPH-dependent curcumin reductase CurA
LNLFFFIERDPNAKLFGPVNYSALLMKRARMEGFIVLDYAPKFGDYITRIAQFVKEGKFKFETDLVKGPLTEAPNVLKRVFTGENFGWFHFFLFIFRF